jgi:hypothetical protein
MPLGVIAHNEIVYGTFSGNEPTTAPSLKSVTLRFGDCDKIEGHLLAKGDCPLHAAWHTNGHH